MFQPHPLPPSSDPTQAFFFALGLGTQELGLWFLTPLGPSS